MQQSVGPFIRAALITVASLALLTGCGGDDGGAGMASSLSARDVGQGLAEGEMTASLSGRVAIVDGVTIDRPAVEVFPANFPASRERRDGTGGRSEIRTSNAAGPYRVQFWLGVQRGDEEPGMGRIYIQLPPQVQAGRTYTLRDSVSAEHGEAFGGVVGPGHAWQINRGLTGSVTVVEAGDQFSLAFEFRNHAEPGSDNYLEASGRAWRVPVTPRAEASYTLSIDGQVSEAVEGVLRQDQDTRFVALVPSVFSLSFEPAPAPGRYRITNRRGPGQAGLNLIGMGYDEVDGHVDLDRDGDFYTASFRFHARGESEVEGEGRFEYLAVSER